MVTRESCFCGLINVSIIAYGAYNIDDTSLVPLWPMYSPNVALQNLVRCRLNVLVLQWVQVQPGFVLRNIMRMLCHCPIKLI